jgi:Uma2 family endonuclease
MTLAPPNKKRAAVPVSRPALFLDGPKPHPGRKMTEKEFLAWVDEYTPAEWVDGEVYIMSPSNFEHSDLNAWLLRILSDYVEHHDLGKVKFDFLVALNAPRRSLRVPDIFFIAGSRVGQFGYSKIEAAPDMVVEIISPDAPARDYREKFEAYEASGVREYWIIDPNARHVEVHHLVRGAYKAVPERAGVIPSKVIKGFFLKPAWLWQEPLPKTSVALRELGVK